MRTTYIIILFLLVQISGSLAIEVGFSATENGESVTIWDDYQVEDSISIKGEHQATFGNLGLSSSREISGSGDLSARQTLSGKSIVSFYDISNSIECQNSDFIQDSTRSTLNPNSAIMSTSLSIGESDLIEKTIAAQNPPNTGELSSQVKQGVLYSDASINVGSLDLSDQVNAHGTEIISRSSIYDYSKGQTQGNSIETYVSGSAQYIGKMTASSSTEEASQNMELLSGSNLQLKDLRYSGDGTDTSTTLTPPDMGASNSPQYGDEGIFYSLDPINTIYTEYTFIGPFGSSPAWGSLQNAINIVPNYWKIAVAGKYYENIKILSDKTFSIEGTSKDKAILDGGNKGTVATVASPATVEFKKLTIQNGLAEVGGGIYNSGSVTLTDVAVQNNLAKGSDGQNGGLAAGGGIYNSGNLNIIRSQIIRNKAQGGEGKGADKTGTGADGWGGDAKGGGIYNTATLTLVDAKLESNVAQGDRGTGGKRTGADGSSAPTKGADGKSGKDVSLFPVFVGVGIGSNGYDAASNANSNGARGSDGIGGKGYGGDGLGGGIYSNGGIYYLSKCPLH